MGLLDPYAEDILDQALAGRFKVRERFAKYIKSIDGKLDPTTCPHCKQRPRASRGKSRLRKYCPECSKILVPRGKLGPRRKDGICPKCKERPRVPSLGYCHECKAQINRESHRQAKLRAEAQAAREAARLSFLPTTEVGDSPKEASDSAARGA